MYIIQMRIYHTQQLITMWNELIDGCFLHRNISAKYTPCGDPVCSVCIIIIIICICGGKKSTTHHIDPAKKKKKQLRKINSLCLKIEEKDNKEYQNGYYRRTPRRLR
jgi:hypothetical protein